MMIFLQKSLNQLSRSEQWSTFFSTVDSGFEDANDWIKKTVKTRLITDNILAGRCLLLSQRYLIMFAYVCNVLSTKLIVKLYGELLAMIGLDESGKRVFN